VDSQNSLIINSTTSNSLLSDIPDNELVSYNSDNEVNEDELDAINGKDDEWILIRLPALAIDGDVLCRKLDEPLWEERYNRKKILRQRNTLGSYWFSAMYQQAPVPADSLIFKQKHFKYFEEGSQYYTLFDELEKRNISKNALSLFATADLAVKASQTADYTVIIVYAVSKKNDILILDVIREKFNATDHIRLLERIRKRWHPLLIGIEGTQYQLQLIQTAIQQGFYIKELKSQGDKVTRSLPIAALMENGKVYFKLNSHWLPTFENELLSFPTGRYDDQVDAFSYITQMLIPFSGVKPVSAKKRSSVNDMSFEGF
jgi:predicted phage terminase large subunit-like protein